MFDTMIFKILNILCLVWDVMLYSEVHEGIRHGIYMDEYCPKSANCKEGTHVLCMHNPDVLNGLGPNCHMAKNVSVSHDLAVRFLAVVNEVRRNVVDGKETGMNGVELPKGYGIWRINWDEELATFAQVLANQCVSTKDMCRATKRFSNPGQVVGIMRFRYPTWEALVPGFTENGFTSTTVDKAILYILRKWHLVKTYVTPEYITKAPDRQSIYLQMVYGLATHMGCGVSAYTDYVFNSEKADFLWNVILLVCNFSGYSKAGEKVYETEQPDSRTHTPNGCPIAIADEDAFGLCHLKNDTESEMCVNFPKICKKEIPIIILPIFSIGKHPIPYPAGNVTLNRPLTKGSQRRAVEVRNVRQYADSILDAHKYLKPNMDNNHVGELYRKRSHVPITRYFRISNTKKKYIEEPEMNLMIHPADSRRNEIWTNQNIRKKSSELDIEKYDTRLINLLDKFEQEIKHTKLRPEDREILNEKIRRIYESLKTKNKYNLKPEDRRIDLNSGISKKKADVRKESSLRERPVINNYEFTKRSKNENVNFIRRDVIDRNDKINKKPTRAPRTDYDADHFEMNRPVITSG